MAKISKKQGSNKTTTEPLSPTTLRKTVNIKISTPIDFSSYMQEEHKSRHETLKNDEKNIASIESFVTSIKKIGYGNVISVENKLIDRKNKLKLLKDQSDSVDYNSLVFSKVYQHASFEGEELTISKPYVRHYGINSEKVVNFKGQILCKELLHPVESLLFEKAIAYLTRQCSVSMYVKLNGKSYSSHVVLVDIFPRKEDNRDIYNNFIIEFDKERKESIVETHTVVLLKNTDKEVILIDPTQKSFSEFLNGSVIGNYTINIYEQRERIYSPKTKDKNIGSPRDCTDIAVKIAFELMEQQIACNNVETVIENALNQISNVDLPKGFKFFRPLQSSDHALRKAAKGFVDSINEKVLAVLDPTKINTLEEVQGVSHLIGECGIGQLDPSVVDTYF